MRLKLDQYWSPVWYLTEALRFVDVCGSVLEPCSGHGSLSERLSYLAKVDAVYTNDLDPNMGADYHLDVTVKDNWQLLPNADWVITNPPYGRSMNAIVENALSHARAGAILFLPITFLEPCQVRVDFLQECPPTTILFYPRFSFRKDKKGNDLRTICCFIWEKKFDYGGITRTEFRAREDILLYHRSFDDAPSECEIQKAVSGLETTDKDELFFSDNDWRLKAIQRERTLVRW